MHDSVAKNEWWFSEGKIFRMDVVVVFCRCMIKCIRSGCLVTLFSFLGPDCCTLFPPPGNVNQYCVLLAPKRPYSCTLLLLLLLLLLFAVNGEFLTLAFCAQEHRTFGNCPLFMSFFRCFRKVLKEEEFIWFFPQLVHALEQGPQVTLFWSQKYFLRNLHFTQAFFYFLISEDF